LRNAAFYGSEFSGRLFAEIRKKRAFRGYAFRLHSFGTACRICVMPPLQSLPLSKKKAVIAVKKRFPSVNGGCRTVFQLAESPF